MENNGTTTQTPVNMAYENNNSNIFSKNIYISLIVATIIGLIIGFLISKFSSKPSVQTITQVVQVTPTPDPRIITDPYTILKSPIFDEWYGGFRAKVIAKDDKSFTVEKNGARLQIFIQKSISRIVDPTVSKDNPQTINVTQLPLGATVDGTVTISVGTLTGNINEHVIANGISIISK